MSQKISSIIFRLFKNNNYINFFFILINRNLKNKFKYKNKFKLCLNLLNKLNYLNKILNIINIKLNFKIINNIELKFIIPYLLQNIKLNYFFNNNLFLKILNIDLNLLKFNDFFKEFNKLNFIEYKFKILKKPFNSVYFIFFLIKFKLKNKFYNLKNIFKYIFLILINKIKKNFFLKGFKLYFSGKVKGMDKSKFEVIKNGYINLNTIVNRIDFFKFNIQTIFGLIGIKIWLFKY